MAIPIDWRNPITAGPGQSQSGVDPTRLLPSRGDIIQARLDAQRQLIDAGTPRFTPVLVTPDGVILDGHHTVRAAAEAGRLINVRVVGINQPPVGEVILNLPVR